MKKDILNKILNKDFNAKDILFFGVSVASILGYITVKNKMRKLDKKLDKKLDETKDNLIGLTKKYNSFVSFTKELDEEKEAEFALIKDEIGICFEHIEELSKKLEKQEIEG